VSLNQKIYWGMGGFALVVLLVIGIMIFGSDQEINGMTPEDVVIKYENALYQEDEKTMYELLIPEDRNAVDLDPSQGPKNSLQIVEGGLRKYQKDPSTIYYEFEYQKPNDPKRTIKDWIKVVHVPEEGWKRAYTLDFSEFERETQGIEPEEIEVKP
jgi:hypothetical protein